MAKKERATWFKVFLQDSAFMDEMTDEELGRIYRAAMTYFEDQTILPLERTERLLFMMMKEHIDEALADYETKKENGKKGGRPKKQTEPEVISGSVNKATITEADAEAETDAEAEAETDKEKEKKYLYTPSPFTPPTMEEVKAYIQKRGYQTNPEVFWDYYTANGWHMGSAPIKDWKAALRNWNRKEKTNGKTEPEPTWTVGITL